MSNRNNAGGFDNLSMFRASRNWLVPYLLLILRNWTLHGYDLMARLAEFGIKTIDHGTIYRTLRQLEKDGHVESTWQNSETGPARRVYSITTAGSDFLESWFDTMNFYRGLVDNFIDFYQTTFTEDKFSGARKAAKYSKAERSAPGPGKAAQSLNEN